MNETINKVRNWVKSDEAKMLGKQVLINAAVGIATSVVINVTYKLGTLALGNVRERLADPDEESAQ